MVNYHLRAQLFMKLTIHFPFKEKCITLHYPVSLSCYRRKVIWYIYFRDAKPKYFAVLLIFPSNQLKNEIFLSWNHIIYSDRDRGATLHWYYRLRKKCLILAPSLRGIILKLILNFTALYFFLFLGHCARRSS